MTNHAEQTFDNATLDHLDRLYTIGRDTSRLAHDLNNQFTTIGGFCELMLGSLPEDHPLFDFAQEVARSCARALETIRSLPVSPSPQATRNESSTLLSTLLELIAEAPESWPAIETCFPSNDVAVRVSGPELTEVLSEILRFACGNSTGRGKITIATQNGDGKAKIQFLLSDPLGSWVASSQRRMTMMMLTATLDRLGGSLTASSVAGGEASLKVILPGSYRQSGQSPVPVSIAPVAPRGTDAPPLIMIVDDDPQFRALLSRNLSGEGYRTVEAEDGRAAVARIDKVSPDLVFLDIFMPEPDGFETLRRIRTSYPAIPVVVMSGASAEYLHTATLLGASDAIPKHELPAGLAGVVRKHTAQTTAISG
ncbi:response regulator [uncultured Paludibaculum sp.]|uniref:response regulator n=1 Tax=uncultured Paludibaculum sp. TaxID=1765020 RepID=UPI002AABA956|nr:response regulator [uncultured Paludibaculum sp.]